MKANVFNIDQWELGLIALLGLMWVLVMLFLVLKALQRLLMLGAETPRRIQRTFNQNLVESGLVFYLPTSAKF